MALRVGFFRQFKGRDTLLFWGAAADVGLLATIFQEVAGGASFDLRADAARIRIGAGRPASLQVFKDAPLEADWTIIAEDAGDYADLISQLVDSDGSGHQYLDVVTSPARLQVMVSAGEYKPSLGGYEIGTV